MTEITENLFARYLAEQAGHELLIVSQEDWRNLNAEFDDLLDVLRGLTDRMHSMFQGEGFECLMCSAKGDDDCDNGCEYGRAEALLARLEGAEPNE